MLIAGPPGSGRSTALRTAAVHHLGQGHGVALVGAQRSPLDDLAGMPGVLGRFGAHDGAALRTAVAAAEGPVLIVVDDADQLLDTEVDAVVGEFLSRSWITGGSARGRRDRRAARRFIEASRSPSAGAAPACCSARPARSTASCSVSG